MTGKEAKLTETEFLEKLNIFQETGKSYALGHSQRPMALTENCRWETRHSICTARREFAAVARDLGFI